MGGQKQHFGRRDVGVLVVQGPHGAYTLLKASFVGHVRFVLPHQLTIFEITNHRSLIQRLVQLQDVHEFGCTPQEDGHHLQKLKLAARVQHEELPQSQDGQQGGRSFVDE